MGQSGFKMLPCLLTRWNERFKRIITAVQSRTCGLATVLYLFHLQKAPRGPHVLTVITTEDEKQATGGRFCFHLFLPHCKISSFIWLATPAERRVTAALPALGATVANGRARSASQLLCTQPSGEGLYNIFACSGISPKMNPEML